MNIEAFFKISYGLYIISSKSGTKMNGYIGNTVFQVTAEPAQVAISCSKENYSSHIIQESNAFSISVLEQTVSSELIGLFGYTSGKTANKFESVHYKTGKTGVPVVLENSIAYFECRVVKSVDVGSHLLFIGEIVSGELINPEGIPLTYDYYRNVIKGMAPKNAPTYIDKSKLERKTAKKTGSKRHKCIVCGYIYDAEKGDAVHGIAEGTAFEELPADWICPICKANKELFEEI